MQVHTIDVEEKNANIFEKEEYVVNTLANCISGILEEVDSLYNGYEMILDESTNIRVQGTAINVIKKHTRTNGNDVYLKGTNYKLSNSELSELYMLASSRKPR